jgi:DNA-binding transcriptional LysR family regulator
MELRHLRYFVAVAEELHFGHAAERLGMAQPPLSRAIRELERQVGATLFERTTRQVSLTPAGHVLLRDARIALETVTAALSRARQAGRPSPTLRVALKADFDAGLLPPILAAYEREPASLPVELVLGGRNEQAPALREGRADVALLVTPFDDRTLDVEPLLTEPLLAALPAADPLAARERLILADLAGRILPDGRPANHPDAPGVASPRQFDLAQIFSLVELGTVTLLLPASLAARHPRPGIAYRPVDDLPPTTLSVAWPVDSHSPAVAAFVRTATAIAASGVGHVGDGRVVADSSGRRHG